MADPTGPDPAPGGARTALLWAGMLSPAVAATAILVLADDARLLRLGVLAALWTALFAVLGLSALRRRMRDEDERVAELQRVYELELEREIAARHEFELEAENEARRRVAEDSGSEIGSLRAELQRLRKALENGAGRGEPAGPAERGAPDGAVPGHIARTLFTGPVPGGAGPSGRPEPAPSREGGQAPEQPEGAGPGTAPPGQVNGGTERVPAGAPGNARSLPERSSGPRGVPSGGQAGSQDPPPTRRMPGRPSAPPAALPSGSNGAAVDPPTGVVGNGPLPTELDTAGRRPPHETSNTASQPDTDQPSTVRVPASEASAPGEPAEAAPPVEQGSWPADAYGDADPAENRASQVAAGAHTEGTSVTDLLAAYGNSGEAKRRRRRGD